MIFKSPALVVSKQKKSLLFLTLQKALPLKGATQQLLSSIINAQ